MPENAALFTLDSVLFFVAHELFSTLLFRLKIKRTFADLLSFACMCLILWICIAADPQVFPFAAAFVAIFASAGFFMMRMSSKKKPKVPVPGADVAACLERFVYIPEFSSGSVGEMISKLVNSIAETHPESVVSPEKAAKAVMEREDAMSTGLDRGVAVPHGTTDAVNELVGAIAIVSSEHGIPGYDTIDNAPVKVVALTLSPSAFSSPNLSVMAYLMRRLRCGDAISELSSCKTPADMKSFFLG